MRIYLLLIACLAGATCAKSTKDVVETLESLREALANDGETGYEGPEDTGEDMDNSLWTQDAGGDMENSLLTRRDYSTGRYSGSVYVRWGRKTCPSSGAQLVYKGEAGGAFYNQAGGGTNYQCLPYDPEWGEYEDGVQGYKAYMYGAEYQLNTNIPFGSTSLHDHDVPCAVCAVPTRGMMLVIPARQTCYSGWTKEYDGYLMTEHFSHAGAKEFVCVDGQPEVANGGHANKDGALFFPVEARCGSLPCPPYVEGRELTCVVCTK